MKTVVLLYPTSCIYEIVILNYFLHFAGKEVLFVSPDGTPITAMEGYSINVSGKLTDIAPDEIELAIVPGGNIKAIDNPIVWNCLKDIKSRGGILAAICAGVDVLDHAGILDGDYVVAEKTPTADDGAIVVAMIEDEATVKRLYREKDCIRLQPENPDFEPIYSREVTVLGKVVAVLRYY